jgi:subtilisin family serine protease
MQVRLFRMVAIVIVLSLAASTPGARGFNLAAYGESNQLLQSPDQSANDPRYSSGLFTDDTPAGEIPEISHRLIVELSSPSLSIWAQSSGELLPASNKVDFDSPAAQNYLSQLENEQANFINTLQSALPGSTISTYIDETGAQVQLTFQILLNAVVIEPGQADLISARETLLSLPGVKAVYLDYAYTPHLYASLPLINAPALWEDVGGRENAGRGIKVASVDGGVHKDAPMFSGEGFSYPPGWPVNGLGNQANNNGKIIASRVYFRPWDPPVPGDDNPWPGEFGTSHGVHTTGIMAGNTVTAEYLGVIETISGVAPAAWVMSYRVFYESVTADPSAYTAEIVAALEDVVRDGADVVNNSWGGGPTSRGGAFDAVDQALINASAAGVFVSMSAGNAGPGTGTTDHPSRDYISVAASTTTGTIAAGRLSVSAPEPVPDELQNIPFAVAAFGQPLELEQIYTFSFVAAAAVDPANVTGCDPWPADTFTGRAALISRGACEFGLKVLNAEQAGAEFVVVYNNLGEELVSMGPGAVGDQVTIPSVFIGQTAGLAMVDWYATHGEDSEITLDTFGFQAGNDPDIIANFSSRGPGVGNAFKPDILAPGVNILSQGYAPGETGEARHLGFGQQSGTSMASPHVAGAAAVLRQVHPSWSNDYVKSALMSTAKFLDIYNVDGTPAQPLDMGAGRLNLTNATDPGVVFDNPSVGFGMLTFGGTDTQTVSVTNISTQTETYTISALRIEGSGFTHTTSEGIPGFTVTPASLTLAPGETQTLTVEFDTTASAGVGDNQGFIILDGETHEAHLPVWARVAPEAIADVLIIDNDFSPNFGVFPDYLDYYTSTLDALGMTYEVHDSAMHIGENPSIPDAATLSGYRAVLLFTGDFYLPNGALAAFGMPVTPLTQLDMDRLTEYANHGGIIIAMGQDLSGVLGADVPDNDNPPFFYQSVLGARFLQDSVTGGNLPTIPVIPVEDAPPTFQEVVLDLSGGTQSSVQLLGSNEVPPVATTMSGVAHFAYNTTNRQLSFEVNLAVTETKMVTSAHIHAGEAGVNGPILHPLFTTPTEVTDTLSFDGVVTLSEEEEEALFESALYINVHTEDFPGGELRAQIAASLVGDGAGNQAYMDEMDRAPFTVSPEMPEELLPYMPLFRYPGPEAIDIGLVGMGHRDQPTLERPGVTYLGRSIYTTFGLEGVNNGVENRTTREELLQLFFSWAMDEPVVTIANITTENASQLTTFEATVSSNLDDITGVQFRWDFGDGSDFTALYDNNVVGHVYETCGDYHVRVEAVDSLGNRAIGELDVTVTQCMENEVLEWIFYLPRILVEAEVIP